MATPTAIDTRARAKAQKAIAKYGRTLILRQPVRQEVTTGAGAGNVYSSPFVANPADPSEPSVLLTVGEHALGLSSGTFQSDGGEGLVVEGDRFTIDAAGHESQVYVVTSVQVLVGEEIESVIEFTPSLVADVPENSEVTIVYFASDKSIKGVCSQIETKFVDGTTTQTGDWQILVSTKALDDAGIVVSEENDLFLGDSTVTSPLAEIVRIARIPSGEQDAALWIFAREVQR